MQKNLTFISMAIAMGLMLGLSLAQGKTPEDFLGAKAPAKGKKDQSVASNSPTKISSTGALDTAKIHLIYLEGDFEKATKTLETHLQSKQPMSHGDSVFAFKHLGVMYAAAADTREKGRYYMYQLINIEPTAKILDMYASDMIYLIFRNVQEDFEKKRTPSAKTAMASDAPPSEKPLQSENSPSRVSTKGKKTMYWVTGGAVLALGTAGLIYILMDSPKPKTTNILAVQ